MKYLKIMVDDENNAEEFWDQFSCSRHAELAVRLRTVGEAYCTPEDWESIKKYPGFSDGPEYAKDALIVVRDDD